MALQTDSVSLTELQSRSCKCVIILYLSYYNNCTPVQSDAHFNYKLFPPVFMDVLVKKWLYIHLFC